MIYQRLKWIALAVWAAVMAGLALLYGKKTGAVLRAAIEAHNQRGKILSAEIERERARVQGAQQEKVEQSKVRLVQLEAEQAKLREKRQALANESSDLPRLSDSDLAKLDNRRRAARSG